MADPVELRHSVAVPSPEPAGDQVLRWLSKELVITVVQSALVALLLAWVFLSFGTASNLLGAWAVAAVAILAIRVHRMALPDWARRRSAARSSRTSASGRLGQSAASAVLARGKPGERNHWFEPLPETLEHRFTRMYRHVDRLSYAVGAPRHYHAGVRPVLAELARDRVRRHHGIDLTDEPERARAVLGEDLWRALTEPLETAPTIQDLDRWLTRLEHLDPERTAAQSTAQSTARSTLAEPA